MSTMHICIEVQYDSKQTNTEQIIGTFEGLLQNALSTPGVLADLGSPQVCMCHEPSKATVVVAKCDGGWRAFLKEHPDLGTEGKTMAEARGKLLEELVLGGFVQGPVILDIDTDEESKIRDLIRIVVNADGPVSFRSILAYVNEQGPSELQDYHVAQVLTDMIRSNEVELYDDGTSFV